MPYPEAPAVVDAMVSLLGRQRVVEGEETAGFSVDGLRPAAAVRPSTVEELASTLAEASRLGAAVIPWGAGTAMALGNLPHAYHLAVDTRSLDHIIEYEPADLTITVEAGLSMARLQQTLAEHGQAFPVDPA